LLSLKLIFGSFTLAWTPDLYSTTSERVLWQCLW